MSVSERSPLCSHLYTTHTIGLLTFSAVVVTIVYGQGKLLYDFPTILWLMLHILFVSFSFWSFRFVRAICTSQPVGLYKIRSRCYLPSFFFVFGTGEKPFICVCTFHVRPKNPLSKRIFFFFPINPFQNSQKENMFVLFYSMKNPCEEFMQFHFRKHLLMGFLRKKQQQRTPSVRNRYEQVFWAS